MGEYFKDKPKNKTEELEKDIYLLKKEISELKEDFVLREEVYPEFDKIGKCITELDHNLANHEHKDGRIVVIDELNEMSVCYDVNEIEGEEYY